MNRDNKKKGSVGVFVVFLMGLTLLYGCGGGGDADPMLSSVVVAPTLVPSVSPSIVPSVSPSPTSAPIAPPSDLGVKLPPANIPQTLVKETKFDWYIRPDGGLWGQCDGKSNQAYPGSGLNQACALGSLFELLPPGETPNMQGGDKVWVASGEYRLGRIANQVDSHRFSDCDANWPWNCFMAVLPSGTQDKPTRLYGESWRQGCTAPPKLVGVERAKRVINLAAAEFVEVNCFEITDGQACGEFHLHGFADPNHSNHGIYQQQAQACTRVNDPVPQGDWAGTGVYGADAKHILLKNINIHGLANAGVVAPRVTDVRIEQSRIVGNAWVGWEGDGKPSAKSSGLVHFKHTEIAWNGCIEQLDGSYRGCWGQTAGGYGDGLGTGDTGGNWIFEGGSIHHNTSDGLDLLYNNDGNVTIYGLQAYANAGNQVKVAGEQLLIANSVINGQCNWFENRPELADLTHCRASGVSLSVSFANDNAQAVLVNNYITGLGDGLISLGSGQRRSQLTAENRLALVNNIIMGQPQASTLGDNTFYIYTESDPAQVMNYDIDYNLVGGDIKFSGGFPGCPYGGNDICNTPTNLELQTGQLSDPNTFIGVDQGLTSGMPILFTEVPNTDMAGNARQRGQGVDLGPREYQ
ncbi:hypothetical protein [Motilimonas sp. E26]|uniref:hypothetical protein n=1 Tax=Motilimonas sp. E26 TaxID=2865674 RepID=UPI001E594A69|nr:hypothetical protein [Motilimonas sp. E26]MCE0555719.1 hypothetical protein [Motilimonas sp. E26]